MEWDPFVTIEAVDEAYGDEAPQPKSSGRASRLAERMKRK